MKLYFVKVRDTVGMIKVGICDHVGKVLKNMQANCPYKLDLMGSVDLDPQIKTDLLHKYLRNTFSYCNVRGKWYTPTLPLREFIAAVCSGTELKEALGKATDRVADINQHPT